MEEYRSKRLCSYCGYDITDMDDNLYEKNAHLCDLCAKLLGTNQEGEKINDRKS